MIEKLIKRFTDKFEAPSEGCWEWKAFKNKDGYGKFLYSGKVGAAHRLMWELVYGEIREGMYVCHKCDNPGCVRYSHLFLGSQRDNVRDCIKKGRFVQNRHAKLTLKQVKEIKEIFGILGDQWGLQTKLTKHYGVGPLCISRIRREASWESI